MLVAHSALWLVLVLDFVLSSQSGTPATSFPGKVTNTQDNPGYQNVSDQIASQTKAPSCPRPVSFNPRGASTSSSTSTTTISGEAFNSSAFTNDPSASSRSSTSTTTSYRLQDCNSSSSSASTQEFAGYIDALTSFINTVNSALDPTFKPRVSYAELGSPLKDATKSFGRILYFIDRRQLLEDRTVNLYNVVANEYFAGQILSRIMNHLRDKKTFASDRSGLLLLCKLITGDDLESKSNDYCFSIIMRFMKCYFSIIEEYCENSFNMAKTSLQKDESMTRNEAHHSNTTAHRDYIESEDTNVDSKRQEDSDAERMAWEKVDGSGPTIIPLPKESYMRYVVKVVNGIIQACDFENNQLAEHPYFSHTVSTLFRLIDDLSVFLERKLKWNKKYGFGEDIIITRNSCKDLIDRIFNLKRSGKTFDSNESKELFELCNLISGSNMVEVPTKPTFEGIIQCYGILLRQICAYALLVMDTIPGIEMNKEGRLVLDGTFYIDPPSAQYSDEDVEDDGELLDSAAQLENDLATSDGITATSGQVQVPPEPRDMYLTEYMYYLCQILIIVRTRLGRVELKVDTYIDFLHSIIKIFNQMVDILLSKESINTTIGGIVIKTQTLQAAKDRLIAHFGKGDFNVKPSTAHIYVRNLLFGNHYGSHTFSPTSSCLVCIGQITRHICAHALAIFGQLPNIHFNQSDNKLILNDKLSVGTVKNLLEQQALREDNRDAFTGKYCFNKARRAMFLIGRSLELDEFFGMRKTPNIRDSVREAVDLFTILLQRLDKKLDANPEEVVRVGGFVITSASVKATLKRFENRKSIKAMLNRNQSVVKVKENLYKLFTGTSEPFFLACSCWIEIAKILAAHAIALNGRIFFVCFDDQNNLFVDNATFYDNLRDVDFASLTKKFVDDDRRKVTDDSIIPRQFNSCTKLFIKALNAFSRNIGGAQMKIYLRKFDDIYDFARNLFSELIAMLKRKGPLYSKTILDVTIDRNFVESAQIRINEYRSVVFDVKADGHEQLYFLISGLHDGPGKPIYRRIEDITKSLYIILLAAVEAHQSVVSINSNGTVTVDGETFPTYEELCIYMRQQPSYEKRYMRSNNLLGSRKRKRTDIEPGQKKRKTD